MAPEEPQYGRNWDSVSDSDGLAAGLDTMPKLSGGIMSSAMALKARHPWHLKLWRTDWSRP